MPDAAPHPPCANCGFEQPGPYCPDCGQSSRPSGQTVHGMLGEFLENILFSLSSRLWRTLGALVAKPGELTRRYLAGQRASQLPPVRTYLILSLLIFLFGPPISIGDPNTYDYYFQGQPIGEKSDERIDYPVQAIQVDEIPARWFPEKARASNARIASIENRIVFHDVLAGRIAAIMPNVMLGLIPVTACLFALIYRRQKRKFFDHLLFALQFQSFCLLVILILSGFDTLLVQVAPQIARPFLMQAYPYLLLIGFVVSLRRVYADGWGWTLAKAAPVVGFYVGFTFYGLPIAYQVALMTV